MKVHSQHSAVIEKILATKPPKHIRTRGNGKPGQTFSMDRFVTLCNKWGLDPAEAALKLLQDPLESSDLKAKEKLDAYIKLMEYAYAKQRAVEHTGSIKVGLAELLAETETEWQAQKSLDS